jgi:hypothetical protein
MRVPQVIFNESNVGIAPPQTGVYNRIAIISEFDRGPANIPSFISDYDDFSRRYGSNNAVGSLAYQAAYDQGAREFCLVRVLGREKFATGAVSFSGQATVDNQTVKVKLGFIGDAVDKSSIPTKAFVETNGGVAFTGSQTGKFWIQITAVNTLANTASIKYIFIPDSTGSKFYTDTDLVGGVPLANVWDGTNTEVDKPIPATVALDLDADHGVYKVLSQGVQVSFGINGDTDPIPVRNNDLFSIRVREYNYSFLVNKFDLANQVVTQAINGLSGREPIGKIEINESGDGIIFQLDPNPNFSLGGSLGNRWHYTFDVSDVTGLSVSSGTSTQFFTGGIDGPRNAFRDFYSTDGTLVMRLIAISGGNWGNQLQTSVYAIDNKRFRLSITDLNGDNYNPALTAESYIISSDNVDGDGFYEDLNSSKFVRGVFLPKALDPINFNAGALLKAPARLAPSDVTVTDPTSPAYPANQGPAYLVNVSLEDGYNGPVITEEDYLEGLDSLKSLPVHLICCPGQYESFSLKVAMIAHAEQAEELEGLRIAILNASPNVTPDWAFRETNGLDSKRGVMVAGWSTYSRQTRVKRLSLSPDAIYAGKLAAIPVEVGPNARRTAGPVIGITETSMASYSSRSSLQLMTDARIEVLAVDQATQSFNFTNGITLSTDTAWEKVYFRRVYDMIRMDLYRALQIYKSETHTAVLRREIESAINAYMTEKVRRGEIAAVGNVRADSTNNSITSYLNYELYVSVEFLPLYSADYIYVSLIRNSQTGQVLFGA